MAATANRSWSARNRASNRTRSSSRTSRTSTRSRTGALVAPETGTYRLGVTGVKGELTIGGKPAVQATTYSQWGEPLKLTDVRLEKGQRYPLRFQAETGSTGVPGLFWKRVSTAPEQDLKAGTADADVIVAVVGLTSDLEGEEMAIKVEGFAGGDKTSLDLPAEQRELLAWAKALGKPLVVVVMNGSAIDLSWAKDNAAAILEAWYPGQSGGAAIADVLTGRADPGGRLPSPSTAASPTCRRSTITRCRAAPTATTRARPCIRSARVSRTRRSTMRRCASNRSLERPRTASSSRRKSPTRASATVTKWRSCT